MPLPVYDIAIRRVIDETHTDRTFVLPHPPGAERDFAFVAGQFVTVMDPEDDVQPPRKKAFSISSSPLDAGRVEVTVRDMGSFGSRFFRFPPGKVLKVIPPRGQFTLDEAVTDDLLLTAGGSGVAPYRSFVRYLRSVGHARPVTVLYSARVPEDLVFDAEFRRHASEAPWFRYVPTVTRLAPEVPFDGLRGRVSDERVRPLLSDPARTTFYACGPSEFVDAALAIAERLGVPKDRRRKEKWG
jgi:ferredoxin-NADP reductase